MDDARNQRVIAWRTPITELAENLCLLAVIAAIAAVIGWDRDPSADVPLWAGVMTVVDMTRPSKRYHGYARHRRTAT